VRDNSSGRCFTPWFVAAGWGGFFRGRGWIAEGAGVLRELRVSEMWRDSDAYDPHTTVERHAAWTAAIRATTG